MGSTVSLLIESFRMFFYKLEPEQVNENAELRKRFKDILKDPSLTDDDKLNIVNWIKDDINALCFKNSDLLLSIFTSFDLSITGSLSMMLLDDEDFYSLIDTGTNIYKIYLYLIHNNVEYYAIVKERLKYYYTPIRCFSVGEHTRCIHSYKTVYPCYLLTQYLIADYTFIKCRHLVQSMFNSLNYNVIGSCIVLTIHLLSKYTHIKVNFTCLMRRMAIFIKNNKEVFFKAMQIAYVSNKFKEFIKHITKYNNITNYTEALKYFNQIYIVFTATTVNIDISTIMFSNTCLNDVMSNVITIVTVIQSKSVSDDIKKKHIDHMHNYFKNNINVLLDLILQYDEFSKCLITINNSIEINSDDVRNSILNYMLFLTNVIKTELCNNKLFSIISMLLK